VDIAKKAMHSGLRLEWTYSAREGPSDMTVSKIASEVACTTPTDISAGGSSPRLSLRLPLSSVVSLNRRNPEHHSKKNSEGKLEVGPYQIGENINQPMQQGAEIYLICIISIN
jgi:hypothetical protein